MVTPSAQQKATGPSPHSVAVDLSAVMVAVSSSQPKVLTVRPGNASDALPSGPLEPQHRTLELGLRAWIAEHTQQAVGYIEQLYTFGDRNRQPAGMDARTRVLSIGYLALVPEARDVDASRARWRDWYGYFPWEDWRAGKPVALSDIGRQLKRWIRAATKTPERHAREERVRATFGLETSAWNDERVLERYELLYEVGLVPEAHRDRRRTWASKEVMTNAEPMLADHRRILATAIARLRGKIKYRPVVFELMPPAFTLSQLQHTVEALSGVRLHTPNFRRLVDSQGLVEDTGELTAGTGGRPARLVRFRREVLLERAAIAVKLPIAKRS